MNDNYDIASRGGFDPPRTISTSPPLPPAPETANAREAVFVRDLCPQLMPDCWVLADLFNGCKARKRLSSFQFHLKCLQDHLGALNDITVHQKLAPKLAAEKPRTTIGQRAAVALVSGHEQSAVQPNRC